MHKVTDSPEPPEPMTTVQLPIFPDDLALVLPVTKVAEADEQNGRAVYLTAGEPLDVAAALLESLPKSGEAVARAISAIHAAKRSSFEWQVLVRPTRLILMVRAFENETRHLLASAGLDPSVYTIEDRTGVV